VFFTKQVLEKNCPFRFRIKWVEKKLTRIPLVRATEHGKAQIENLAFGSEL